MAPAAGLLAVIGTFMVMGLMPAFTLLVVFAILHFGSDALRQLHDTAAGSPHMQEVASAIHLAVNACLRRHYRLLGGLAAGGALMLGWMVSWPVASGFLLGATLSATAVFLAVNMAVRCNLRIAAADAPSVHARRCAMMVSVLVTAMILAGFALYHVALTALEVTHPMHALAAYALGSSLMALHARLGGGLMVQAARSAVDGLLQRGLMPVGQHDSRNMATMVEQAAVTVAEIGGMSADLAETLVLGLAAAMLAISLLAPEAAHLVELPMLLVTLGLAALAAPVTKALRQPEGDMPTILRIMLSGAMLVLAGFMPLAWVLLEQPVSFGGEAYGMQHLLAAVALGLGLALLCAVQRAADHAAVTPWRGLLRLREVLLPLLSATSVIWAAYALAGTLGVILAAMAALSLLPGMLALHVQAPLLANAAEICRVASAEDASACACDSADGARMLAASHAYSVSLTLLVVWLALLAFAKSMSLAFTIDLLDARVMVGLMLGGAIPYVMLMTMQDAVRRAAAAMMQEVRRQFALMPGIVAYRARPEFGRCMEVLTQAVFIELLIPALLPLVMVRAASWLLGREALSGMVLGAAVVGFFMTYTRAFWTASEAEPDLPVDQVREKLLVPVEPVAGDLVLYQETCQGLQGLAGPTLNPVIKLVAVAALLTAVLG